jgi:hypothetical protein
MKTKRFLGYGVTAVLLSAGLLTLALAGCGDESAGSPEGDSGEVSFSIVLSEASLDGKTGAIQPSLADAITTFRVDHKETTTEVEDFIEGIEPSGPTVEVRLPRGTYDLRVTGYKDGLAIAQTNTVNVAQGQTVVTPFLAPITPEEGATGDGTFDYDVSILEDPSFKVATIELRNEDGTDTSIPVGPTGTGSVSLPAGTYLMTATVADDKRSPHSVSLYIYAGVTTTMKLGKDCFGFKQFDTIVIEMNNSVLVQNGLELTANEGFTTSVKWFIDDELWYSNASGQDPKGAGVTNGGFTFDWAAASAESDYEVGSLHAVRLEGRVDHVWLSQTVWFARTQPLAAVYYVNDAAESDSKDGTTEQNAFKTLSTALKAPVDAVKGRTIKIIGNYLITKDQAIDGNNGNGNGNGTTTVTRAGQGGPADAVITVANGAEVTFRNITINGIGGAGANNRGLKVTGTNTRVTLDTGTTVTGSTAANGGGVLVEGGATLAMKNGSIVTGSAAANGGGVAVAAGTFRMQGGVISKNTATGNGGGVWLNGTAGSESVFTMTGGTVHGTDSTNDANTASTGTGASLYAGTNATASKSGMYQGTSDLMLTAGP